MAHTELCHIVLTYLTTMHMTLTKWTDSEKNGIQYEHIKVGIRHPNYTFVIYSMEQN